MHALLLVHATPDHWAAIPDPDDESPSAGHPETYSTEAIARRAQAVHRLRNAGVLVACSELTSPAQGSDVRVSDSRAVVNTITPDEDPIAGFYLLNVNDLAHAEALATTVPEAIGGHISIRPLVAHPAGTIEPDARALAS